MRFLEVSDLKGGYAGRLVLNGVSFSVEKGEFMGIIGPNGAGKTTLLKSLTQILRPLSGKVLIDGHDIHKMKLEQIAKICAFVSQDITSIFSFTVEEIVLMGRTPYIGLFGHEDKEDLNIVHEVMKLVGLLDLKDKPINELSAGERQRALISKALAQTPQFLLLDEPTTHLDIGHQIEILDLIKSLKETKGLTIISVLHDLNLASQYCDRIIVLDKGIISDCGTPKEVLRYDIIEKIFGAVVLVNNDIFKDRPFVIPISRGLY